MSDRVRYRPGIAREMEIWHTLPEAMRLLNFRYKGGHWQHIKAVRRWVKVFDGQGRVLRRYQRSNGGVWI